MTECSMRYNYLGNSGLKVSNICLGTLTFGESERGRPGQANEELSHQLMDRFVEKGGNYIDTANNYQLGLSEKIVGSWLKKRQNRESLVIATKARMAMNFDDPNGIGLSRKHILWTVEESLKRLQTDYIDLYQMHIWDAATPIEESLRTMDDLVRSGKVRYVGVSNFTGWQLQKTADVCKYMGLQKVVSLQAQYSLLVRGLEYELVDVCKNEGIGILPWSPLKGGWLTGKARHGVPPPRGSRMSFVEADRRREYESHPSYSCFADDPQVNDILDKVDRIAKEQGKTMAQVSLRWLLQKDTVPSVVIGAKTLQQLNENMGASSGWELNDSQMNELDAASQMELFYPYKMTARLNMNRHRKYICK